MLPVTTGLVDILKYDFIITDPKQRVRDESDDNLGIVLSPQRRSFLTGCHVTSNNSTTGAAQRDEGRLVEVNAEYVLV